MRYSSLALLCLPAVTLGCGGQKVREAAPSSGIKHDAPDENGRGDKAGAAQDKAGGEAEPKTPRKIIYTANLVLIVDDFDKASEALDQLIEENKGFISTSDIRGERGTPRSGQWTVRVPEARYKALVGAIAKLGEATQSRSDSQDVSGSYYDTKERLKTFTVEEEGLRKYYENKSPTAKPEDMMAVRRELTQIRAQIEEMTGRLKRWDSQVEFSTVVVNMHDRKDYVPPVVANFGGSVGRAFHGSIELLVDFGKGLVLTVVAAAPWLAIVALLGSPFWLRWRRSARARKAATTTPAAPIA
jgi:hypothetical protein